MNNFIKSSIGLIIALGALSGCGDGGNKGWSDEDVRSTVTLVGEGPARYIVSKGCSGDEPFYTFKYKGANNNLINVKTVNGKVKDNCMSSSSILNGDKIMQIGKGGDNKNVTAFACDGRNKVIFTRKNSMIDLTTSINDGEC